MEGLKNGEGREFEDLSCKNIDIKAKIAKFSLLYSVICSNFPRITAHACYQNC
jgi:hypothetical protein